MLIICSKRYVPASQAGATLIEVLVTVVVTSIGLLGMAGLMAVSTKVNHDAYLNTQANFIAQTLIESMHINASAVADGRYDGTYTDDSGSDPGCRAHGCSPTERAEYDRVRFDSALRTTLPNPTASVKCTAGNSPVVPSAAPYGGTCRLEVDWSERALSAGGDSGIQSLVWIFQP
jgi:type IV pilus assembly protein PilV